MLNGVAASAVVAAKPLRAVLREMPGALLFFLITLKSPISPKVHIPNACAIIHRSDSVRKCFSANLRLPVANPLC
jgi:hypothetical protein